MSEYQTANEEPCVHCRAGDHGDCTENYCTCDCPAATAQPVTPAEMVAEILRGALPDVPVYVASEPDATLEDQ